MTGTLSVTSMSSAHIFHDNQNGTGIYMSIVKIDRNFHVSQNHKCIAMLRNAFRKAAENAILQVLFIGHLLWPQSVTN